MTAPDSPRPARWWHTGDDGRVHCDLCPRACTLKDGQRAFCFVRENVGGQMVLTTWGRSTGFCIDPIEKKPLAHFYPGTSVLSFGTAGCNLGCKFCQNWSISKSREVEDLSERASPEAIARAAQRAGCTSVAFTYNDPVIWAEYAIDTARACRALGLKTVAVTAGYISPDAREEFFRHFDAANIDLKAFTEDFYTRITASHLDPVLDTLRYVARETACWLEVTNLVIPGHNDSPDEIARMVDWIASALGAEVPVHFSAYHPDFKLAAPATPASTLRRARQQALAAGLRHVYTGNIHDPEGDTTSCTGCGDPLVVRDWYAILHYGLDPRGCCPRCGTALAGRFGAAAGTWGRKRLRVAIEG